MTVKRLAPLLLGAAVFATLPACDVSSPERFIRAPIIRSFSPENPTFQILTGDTVVFSVNAIDPEEGQLTFDFLLDDSLVAGASSWTYVVEDTGDVEVSGRVYNRASRSMVTWLVKRIAPVNRPPVIVDFQPPDLNPAVRVGNAIAFSMSAEDPEHRPVSYIFTVDDSLVSGSNQYVHQATKVGEHSVKSIASDGEAFTTHEWSLKVLAEPDSIPPAPVIMTSLETGQQTGELVVEWIAVGDDSLDGLATAYVARTSPVPIDGEEAWFQASDRPGEPPPAAAGQTQQMVIGFLPPAEVVHVAVRAVDDFGNLSGLANSFSARVKGNDLHGTVRDAVTGDPIPNVGITLAGDADTTDASGQYSLHSLPSGAASVRLRDDYDSPDFGAYFDVITDPIVIQDEEVFDLWMLPNMSMETTDYSSFLDFAKSMTNRGGEFWYLTKTWDHPMDVYVIPFTANGLEYTPVIEGALLEWEDLTGLDLFHFVDAIPDVGLYVTYSGTVSRDIYRVLEFDERQLPIKSEIVMRTVYDPSNTQLLDTTAGHEVGHALGMGHSDDEGHLMIGGRVPVVTQPTLDEIHLIRALYRLPRGQSMNWFHFD
jgi:hypothetical protein